MPKVILSYLNLINYCGGNLVLYIHVHTCADGRKCLLLPHKRSCNTTSMKNGSGTITPTFPSLQSQRKLIFLEKNPAFQVYFTKRYRKAEP